MGGGGREEEGEEGKLLLQTRGYYDGLEQPPHSELEQDSSILRRSITRRRPWSEPWTVGLPSSYRSVGPSSNYHCIMRERVCLWLLACLFNSCCWHCFFLLMAHMVEARGLLRCRRVRLSSFLLRIPL